MQRFSPVIHYYQFCCDSLLPVFGVRVSVTFHHIFVHIIFSSVWVAQWPPFGKELPTRLTICSLCILTICNLLFYYLFPVLVLRAGFGF